MLLKNNSNLTKDIINIEEEAALVTSSIAIVHKDNEDVL